MSVRITRTVDGQRTILEMAGRLQSPFLSELDKELRSIDGPLLLDLSDLRSADEAGIERLRQLASSGVEFRGASGYVRMLLDDKGS